MANNAVLEDCPACGCSAPILRTANRNSTTEFWYQCECSFSSFPVQQTGEDLPESRAVQRWNEAVQVAHDRREAIGKDTEMDLASLVHRLIRQVKKTDPKNAVATSAREYLETHGFKFTDHLRDGGAYS